MSSTGYFSLGNYGDYIEQKIIEGNKDVAGGKDAGGSSSVKVANRRASRFLKHSGAYSQELARDYRRCTPLSQP